MFNCANEAACLRCWFDHMREVRTLCTSTLSTSTHPGLGRKLTCAEKHCKPKQGSTRAWGPAGLAALEMCVLAVLAAQLMQRACSSAQPGLRLLPRQPWPW